MKTAVLLSTLLSKNTSIIVEQGSSLTIEDDCFVHEVPALTFTVQQDGRLNYTFRVLESAAHPTLARSLTVILAGKGAAASLTVRVLAEHDQKISFITKQHHLAADTTSFVSIKGVLAGSVRLSSENLIRIEKAALGSKAHEEHKSLLLSDQARVISIPKLEVEAHDVSCKHGSATSYPSEESLFYLKSRGIDEKSAQKLIVDAFLAL